jgi:ribonucleoside-diphosphate reductase alpha chain
VKDVFRVSHDIEPEWHVRMQAAFQKHTDNSVSKTINFPYDATIADIGQAYMLAYETGCKGITVYRDGSKADQVLSTGDTGKHTVTLTSVRAEPLDRLVTGSVEAPAYRVPRERPRQIHGITERVRTGHGNMYITINFDEAGKPFEVFGTLGKAGGCDSAQLEAISRLVSLALRSGVDAHAIIEQLRGITCCPAWDEGVLVRSGPDAVALALGRHLLEDPEEAPAHAPEATQLRFTAEPVMLSGGNSNHVLSSVEGGVYYARKCPDCNGPVIFQEGCVSCVDPACGWNKCE